MSNETNIEEDIKILKKYEILELGISSELSDESEITLERYNKAIENILADRERVLEENRALREDYQTENQYYKGEYDALVEKMKDEIENNEWSTKEYDCDTADYKQSQAIGAWNVLIKIKQELIPEEE